MKIGYPCINTSLPRSSQTFRLASYTEERLVATVESNLNNLLSILEYNLTNNLLFFRISSQLIPFASHPVCKYPWQEKFGPKLAEIGEFVKKNNMRISMHPDQFVLLSAINENTLKNSISELVYQASVLDLMQLDATAKLQIHLGGVYGDKTASLKRFVAIYKSLPENIRNRLVIENDDHLYSFDDCYNTYEQIGIPILFDTFHWELLHGDVDFYSDFVKSTTTWKSNDGVMMVDYSSQESGGRRGKHAQSVDIADFRNFLIKITDVECDVMLEIKDKEVSALQAINILSEKQVLSR